MRPNKDEYMMHLAVVARSRSTCTRPTSSAPMGVGCVISLDGRVVATGYNGSSPGHPHCTEVGHFMVDGRCVRTVHAEQNAVAQAVRHGVPLMGSVAYVTAHPCMECAKLLCAAGVRSVVFLDNYRNTDEITRTVTPAMKYSAFTGDRVWERTRLEFKKAPVPVIVVEGIDGAGKSTVVNRLADEFACFNVLAVHEPGDTEVGTRIRQMLVDLAMCNEAKTLVFAAARAQLMSQVVGPAILAGRPVISDRSFVSSMVYQADSVGTMESVISANHPAIDEVMAWPTDIVLLDVEASTAMTRSKKTEDPGGFDAEALEKHDVRRRRYHHAVQLVAALCGSTIHVVPADQSEERVISMVRNIVTDRLSSDPRVVD